METETKSQPKPLMMLKDFLRDDPNSSSNDFPSLPRRSDNTVRKLLEIDLNSEDPFKDRRLSRSQSRKTTISAFQKASEAVIKAVRHLPFSSAKSPPKHGFLPRSFSLRRSFRKKKKKKEEKEKREIRARISVRDIIRWKSFQDEEEKIQKPLHLPCSISGSCNSSWHESDFTSDSSSDCSVETDGKKDSPKKRGGVGEDSMGTATCCGESKVKQWKGEESIGELESKFEEKEQLSPVSVLDFSYEDEEIETPSSAFEDSLANMERTKQHLLQKIRRFECLAQMDPIDLEKRIAQSELKEESTEVIQAEDKAGDLLHLLKASSGKLHTRHSDKLLLDFFREGLATSQSNLLRQADAKADGTEEKLLSAASDWMNGYVEYVEWGIEDDWEACLGEMTWDDRWRKFKEEEEELAMEMESRVLGSLVEELLLDLFD